MQPHALIQLFLVELAAMARQRLPRIASLTSATAIQYKETKHSIKTYLRGDFVEFTLQTPIGSPWRPCSARGHRRSDRFFVLRADSDRRYGRAQ